MRDTQLESGIKKYFQTEMSRVASDTSDLCPLCKFSLGQFFDPQVCFKKLRAENCKFYIYTYKDSPGTVCLKTEGRK
jgi:hypothetical protein